MAQIMNQFAQTAEKGMVDLKTAPASILACDVNSTQATPLVPGQCVTIVDVAGGIPNVISAAAENADVFGVVVYNIKDASFPAGSKVEVAFGNGTVVYMEAASAIAPYQRVGLIVSGEKVAVAGTGDRIIGVALDKAAGDGSLIRVLLQLPGAIA